MKNYEKENNGCSYMLVVIDTFCKFAWFVPLKNKDGKSVSMDFKKVLVITKLQNIYLQFYFILIKAWNLKINCLKRF